MKSFAPCSLFILTFLFLITLNSCKTKVPAKTEGKPITEKIVMEEKGKDTISQGMDTAQLKEIPESALVIDSLSCRLMVQFISAGEGINSSARLSLEQYQMKFSMDENLPLRPRRIPKGREGEIEYCYPMYGFPADKAESFIDGLRKIMENQPLVIIEENKKQALR